MTTSILHGTPASFDPNGSGDVPRADFGDVRGEFAALVSGGAICDLRARARIVVTGKDRVRWLNGMVSNNVRDLSPGQGVYAFVLTPQGRILGDLYAYQQGDSLLLDIARQQLEKLLPLLKRYIIMDDVKLADTETAGVGVAGGKSRDLLRAAGLDLPALQPLQFAEVISPVGSVSAVRGDHPTFDSFELRLSPENLPALWATLVKAGFRPAGTASLELLRVALGIPLYGQDIRERDLPQETGQDRALNFTKGCYIGQEIVERIRSRGAVHRKFTGFLVDGPLPPEGVKIQSGGKDVGEITSPASLPLPAGDLAVALGYVRREAAAPDAQLIAGSARLQVAGLPFKQAFNY